MSSETTNPGVPTSDSLAAGTPTAQPANKIPTTQEIEASEQAGKKREQAIVAALTQTPIRFYGKVVDENGNPVNGAKIAISAADVYFGTGSAYERTSNSDGLFSIEGIHGMGLTVSVSKEGYYELPQSQGNFAYAFSPGNELPPHPGAADPAIFVLRKMGETEPLIVRKIDINLNKVGGPVTMDLQTGKAFGNHRSDLEIQTWVNDQGIAPGAFKRYDWRCVISVPGGGLQSRGGGGFDFIAPDSGYQASDEIDVQASDPNWRPTESREYFLKLASGEYARISFVVATSGYNGCSVTSYLNPVPGRRNLEYNPNQQTSSR